MTRRTHPPRLLLGMLLGAGFWFGACSVLSDNTSSESEIETAPFDGGAALPTVSEEDAARALRSLAAQPVFQAVTEGNDWEVAEVMPNVQEGGSISGIGIIIALARRVDSDGPWIYASCRGTRITEATAPFRGITTLGAVFDNEGTLLSFKPLLADGTTLLPPQSPRPSPQPCPPGFEDPEN
ncbi:MAG: hypothetical protein AB7J35_15845 [Dehalococcoidia bacterium]